MLGRNVIQFLLFLAFSLFSVFGESVLLFAPHACLFSNTFRYLLHFFLEVEGRGMGVGKENSGLLAIVLGKLSHGSRSVGFHLNFYSSV